MLCPPCPLADSSRRSRPEGMRTLVNQGLRMGRQRPCSRMRNSGMALVLVLGALALIALIAGRFAQRIDSLRGQTTSLLDHAQQRLQARNALAATLYLVATRPIGPAGYGPAMAPELRADDRPYRLPGGGEVRVQDPRGLYALNAPRRGSLSALLRALGVAVSETDTLIDVLEDYLDTDNLKRLNGAEATDYAALGLPAPRNDWLLTTGELNRMPRWRDAPQVVAALERWGSTARNAVLNPNTAPIELLASLWPQARPEQLQLLSSLRKQTPFADGRQAQRMTGLPLDRDEVIFSIGPQVRITVSAQGSPGALQYNVTLTPAGIEGPWLISDMQPVLRTEPHDTSDHAEPFPLAISASQ